MSLTLLGIESFQLELAAMLVKSDYVGFVKGKGINFSKGIKSPGVYGDCRKVLSDPVLRSVVLAQYISFAAKTRDEFSGIAAVETGGIGFAAILAERFSVPYLGVRKEPKGHGDQSWFAGDIELFRNRTVLVLEDMTTTAGSLLGAVQPLKEQLNCVVTTALTTFSYAFPEMIKQTDDAKIDVYALCTFEQMLQAAVNKRRIDSEYQEIIENWLNNPHDESWITDEWKF